MTNEIHHAKSNIIFVLAMSMIFILGASVDIFVPSLPFIHQAMHSSMQETQLMIAVYLITYGFAQLFFGSISDSFGRRPTLLVSLIAVVITIFCIPFSHSIHMLLVLRGIEGILTAGVGVTARVLLSDTFSGKELGKRATYVTFMWSIGTIISPFIGGHLQHWFGWKAPFYFLGGYTLAVTLYAIFLLPETTLMRHNFHIKTIITNYVKVYSYIPFLAGAITCGSVYSLVTIYNVAGPFLIEKTLGYGPIVYGRIALLLGVFWLMGNLLCRYLLTTSFIRRAINIALGTAFAIALLMIYISHIGAFNLWTSFIPVLGIFFVGGSIFPYCFGRCISFFPKVGGTASAALGGMFSLIAALGSAIASGLKATSLMPLSLTYMGVIICAIIFAYIHGHYKQ